MLLSFNNQICKSRFTVSHYRSYCELLRGTNFISSMSGKRSCKCGIILGLMGVAVCCLTLVVLNQWFGNPLKRRILSILVPECYLENIDDIEGVDEVLGDMEKLIDEDRRLIHKRMIGYPYPNGKYNISARKIEDLVMEKNGKPVRSVILSTYHSGSSFLGEILKSHPGNLHFFKPISHFEFLPVRGPPLAAEALRTVKALLNCEYEDLEEYMKFDKTHGQLLYEGTHLWERCTNYDDMCYNSTYLSSLCKLFPFQSMKLVHLRLRFAEELLADHSLGVRLVLLVRDPRGSLESLKHVFFPKEDPNVTDIAEHCEDLVDDYKTAVEFKKKYPNTFRVIRYEDLTDDPYKKVKELFEFYGRNFDPKVKEYLDTHMKVQEGNSFSTFRNIQESRIQWRMDLTFDEVKEIQRHCAAAMKYWGYLPAINSTHQKEFNPITDYTLEL